MIGLRLSLALAVCSLLAGCYFDQRKSIAYEVLFFPNGWPNSLAFAGALSAKFPSGTPASELESFSARFGGSCSSEAAGTLSCEIPIRGMPCAVSVLVVKAAVDAGKLKSLNVIASGGGC